MLKKTITYKDFNGESVTEDLFFHLSQPELLEVELDFQPDGLSAALQKMMDAEDGRAIFHTFKDMILKSYGKKSSDGRRFIKNSLIREEFESSKAWETVFMELATDQAAMNAFIIGIIPPELAAQAEVAAAIQEQLPQTPKPEPHRMTMSDAVAAWPGVQLSEKIIAGEIVIVDE